jgi:glycosyltransferase involved in cell wall biosynthesis
MPAFNEAEHIESCILEWHEHVVARIPGAEIVIVDDCSTDGTAARLAALAARLPALRVLRTAANSGHGPAVRWGIDHCAGEFVFQTDSDRQFTPADFDKVWARRTEADFVFGVRQQRADGSFRLYVSRVLQGVNYAAWGLRIDDANCPFKLMRREALQSLLREIPRASFIPMVLISVLARYRGYRVLEVPVRHYPRSAGEQSLKGLLTWARIGARCLREVVALRLSTARGVRRGAPAERPDVSRVI